MSFLRVGKRGCVSWKNLVLSGKAGACLTVWLLETKAIVFCLYCHHLVPQKSNSPPLPSNHMGLTKWTPLCFACCFLTATRGFISPKVCLCYCFGFDVYLSG